MKTFETKKGLKCEAEVIKLKAGRDEAEGLED